MTGTAIRKRTEDVLVLGVSVDDRAHGVAGRFNRGEDLAVDREGIEPDSEEAVALIGGDDDAQRLAVDLDGDRLG
jgi:hypothetical protein